METTDSIYAHPEAQQPAVITQEIYDYAANLLIHGNKNSLEVKKMIMQRGYDEAASAAIVQKLETEIRKLKKDRAGKDILYGSLWCVGGTVLTISNIGFIFWGAIIFGGVQLVKDLINYSSAD